MGQQLTVRLAAAHHVLRWGQAVLRTAGQAGDSGRVAAGQGGEAAARSLGVRPAPTTQLRSVFKPFGILLLVLWPFRACNHWLRQALQQV